jgi:hypothetical protein
MAGRRWIGLVVVTACTFDAGSLGTEGSGAAGSDSSSTSTGQPPATSVDATDTDPATAGETTALDSTTGTSGGTSGGSSSGDEPTCDASPAWWDRAWARRRLVTVNASSVDEALTSVPIRLRLDDARIDYAAVEDAGADLRFIGEDGSTELAYEVERWDERGDSEVWLRIPLVPAGSMPMVWMYYGNAAAAPGDDPPAVWDADFVSVHHLADLGDATAGGHDGFGASLPADAEGRIGRGRFFDGNDDAVELPQEADFDFEVALTVEAWTVVSSFTVDWQAIVTKGDDAWRLHRQLDTPFVGFGSDTSTTNDNFSGTTPIDDGNWHHVAIVYGDGEKQIYVDGQLDASEGYPGPLNVTNAAVMLGSNADTGGRFFHGTLDEVRISRVARSASWIELQAHASADMSIVSVGDEEVCP